MSHILRFFYNVLFDNPINDMIRVSYTRLYLVIKQSKSEMQTCIMRDTRGSFESKPLLNINKQ